MSHRLFAQFRRTEIFRNPTSPTRDDLMPSRRVCLSVSQRTALPRIAERSARSNLSRTSQFWHAVRTVVTDWFPGFPSSRLRPSVRIALPGDAELTRLRKPLGSARWLRNARAAAVHHTCAELDTNEHPWKASRMLGWLAARSWPVGRSLGWSVGLWVSPSFRNSLFAKTRESRCLPSGLDWTFCVRTLPSPFTARHLSIEALRKGCVLAA